MGLPRILALTVLLVSCAQADRLETGQGPGLGEVQVDADHSAGELGARPGAVTATGETGTLPLPGPDEGVLFVPESYRPNRPAPLAISLHGCCGEATGGLGLIKDAADRAGVIVVAPEGTGGSWDVLSGGFGPDVEVIDAALREVFASYSIDPTRVAISGFSDGASYALSLGLTNGELFTHVIAHSPGFMAPGELEGRPEIFIAHGREDRTLPFDNTQQLVAELEENGHAVLFRPFDAGHKRQPHIFADAVRWFVGS